jgi:secreted trypsin-like serine protease
MVVAMPPPRTKSALLAALAVVLVIALVPAAASATTATTSVVNGEGAVHGSFPYLAFVVFREGSSAEACSGTVVSSNVILTAAHCVVDEEHGVLRPASAFKVVTGNVEWGSPERVVSTVSAVAVYPEYTWTGDYTHWGDAAVLQLSRPIPSPAVKLASSEAWATGSGALMVGWGKTASSQSGASPLLHYGETQVQSPSYCAGKSSHFHSNGQLCVLDPSHLRSACNGDSGGPLLVVAPGTTNEPLEIGIASFVVNSSCSTSSPQYYTRADLVAPWVAAQVAAVAPPPSAAPAEASSPAAASPAPTLPRLGAAVAKGYVKTALTQVLGYRFESRRGYRLSCEALEPTKRSCKVTWGGGPFSYAGWVTVFYALESSKVVWRYSYRIERKVARCAKRRCPVQLFKSESPARVARVDR